MNKGVLVGLGVAGVLLLSSSGTKASPAEAPPPPKPLPPPPPGDPTRKFPESGFFNWVTKKPADVPPFLSWVPGKDGPPPVIAAPPKGIVLPKQGERYEIMYSVNRELGFFEKAAAKDAFRTHMKDQTLESLTQSSSAPWTVTLMTSYKTDALGPIPIGQTAPLF